MGLALTSRLFGRAPGPANRTDSESMRRGTVPHGPDTLPSVGNRSSLTGLRTGVSEGLARDARRVNMGVAQDVLMRADARADAGVLVDHRNEAGGRNIE